MQKSTIGFRVRKVAPIFTVLLVLFSACDLAQVVDSSKGNESGEEGGFVLNQETAVLGLKQALQLSAGKTSEDLGSLNGYLGNELIKLALPEDVADVLTEVIAFENEYASELKGFGISLGFEDMRDSMIISLNRAAEAAAPKSLDIFVNAITDMSIEDGKSILFTEDTAAATSYLHSNTFSELTGVYLPIVQNALDKVKANQLWNTISSNYNKNFLPAVKTIKSVPLLGNQVTYDFPGALPEDLSDYATDKALSGLFSIISIEESKLRKDITGRLSVLDDFLEELNLDSELLQNVFTALEKEFVE
jgi:hypothetical protein